LDLVGELPIAPSGLAVTDEAIFVSDYEQHCIFKIEGTVSSVFGGKCGEVGYQNGDSALFENPRGLAIDGEGNLLVADAGNNAIRSIAPNGDVETIAGTGTKFVISSEGPALESNVYIPFGLAIHPSGDLYFSGFDHCIRRLRDGMLEDVAGLCLNYGNTGTDDGQSFDARFDTPMDIAFAPDGRLMIADGFNDRIRVLSADFGTVDTLVGSEPGYQDGTLDTAMFDVPRSLTVDENGIIYVADSVNNRIRVVNW
jgi:DNA-binding beta-propeller fold protein YncE